MGSFTDNTQALTQFNPYVQQLPVEAMVSVGQQKQQQYNEGVQKIQSHIDQIAGMDVVRDVDRQYLQSQLNNLGTNLKKVAAGDFSNYQLVNSVSGMATRIGKDGNVQNAVASTARYRKEVANMEAAIKDGKSAIQNEWDFSNKANAWLGSTELKQSFSDRYTPYTDVSKKWMEVVKGLHSDLVDMDIAYELNADGSPNYSKTLAAMQRISKESVSSAKIENALRASLSPLEANQLSIDGRFTFRGYDTPEKLAVYAKTKYESLTKENDEAIKNLKGVAELSTSNAETRKRALDTIKELEIRNVALQEQMTEEAQFIMENPEEAKSYIYKNGAIAQFAQAHSWEHDKSSLLANPVKAQENWEKNYAMDKSKFNLDLAKFDWQKYKDNADLTLRAQKQQQELYGSLSDAVEIYGGQNTNVKSPLISLRTDIQTLETSSKKQKIDFLKGNPSVSPAQLENLISDYKAGIDVLGVDAKTIIPEEWKSTFYEIVETDNKANRKKSFLDSVVKEVEQTDEYKNSKPGMLELMTAGATNYGRLYQSPELAIDGRDDLINAALMNKTGVYIPRLVGITTGKTESGDGETAAKTKMDDLVLGKIMQYSGGKMGIPGGSEEFMEADREAARGMLEGEKRKHIMYKKLTQGDKTFLVMSDGTKEAIIPIGPTELGFLPVDPNAPTPAYQELYETQAFNNGKTNPSKSPESAYYQRYAIPNASLDVRADLKWDMKDTSRNYPILMLNLGNNDWIDITVAKGLPREQAAQLIRELTDDQIKQLFLMDKTVSEDSKEKIRNLK